MLIDTTPGNHQFVGLLAKLFPDARFVHCRRDPLDTCLSCYFQNFFLGNQITFDLTDLGVFYRQWVAFQSQKLDHFRESSLETAGEDSAPSSDGEPDSSKVGLS